MSLTLITGATGGLGAAVADFLKEKSNYEKIAVLVRDPKNEKAKILADKGFEIRVGDYTDPDSLIKAFAGVTNLYFVSASDLEGRFAKHKQVVEVAKNAGVDHIFYTSAGLDKLDKEAPLYSVMSSHIETEKLIKDSGMKYTILQHNLYSEVIPMFLGTKDQLLGSKSVFLPTDEGKTAFVPRTELAEAGAIILSNPANHVNKVYEMNGSESVGFGQVAEILTDVLGEKIGYVSPDVSTFESTLKGFGVPDMYIGMMRDFGLAIADGAFESSKTDLETLLGRKTQPVADFLNVVYG
ncbi:MAG: SDR family oxidoreductase [Cyclobacteriaceae bacterium]|nr:SDR family oxidoreductase [Cyclobacteriaceae bacterium SS2]